jgi:hypothetical protein
LFEALATRYLRSRGKRVCDLPPPPERGSTWVARSGSIRRVSATSAGSVSYFAVRGVEVVEQEHTVGLEAWHNWRRKGRAVCR